MEVKLNEIKKILDWRSILLVVIMGSYIWLEIIQPGMYNYRDDKELNPKITVAESMLSKYGESIDENEMTDFKNETLNIQKEADDYLFNSKRFREAGITNYNEFMEASDSDEKIKNIISLKDPKAVLFDELEVRYDLINKFSKWGDSTSVLNNTIVHDFTYRITNFIFLVIVSVCIMTILTFMRDKKDNVEQLQYTSLKGRNLAKVKISMALIISIIMVTLEMLLLFTIYGKNGSFKFWNCKINGAFSEGNFWCGATFGQYIILTILIVYIVACVVASISMYLGYITESYIKLILWLYQQLY